MCLAFVHTATTETHVVHCSDVSPIHLRLNFNPELLEKLEGADQFVAGLTHALEEAVHDAADPVARV